MPVQEFKLPDLGEGLTEGDILKWTVAVGDTVEVNDTIAEVETVKAAVELPSPYAGTVTALLADEGTTVPVGTPIISIDTGGVATENAAAGEDMVPAVPGEPGTEEKQLTLVGYGPREESGRRRRRRPTNGAVATEGAQVSFNLPPAPAGPEPAVVEEPAPVAGHARALAKPPVRKLAKTLGVDLATVRPTGPNGVVTRDDVEAAARTGGDTAPAAPAAARRRPLAARDPPADQGRTQAHRGGDGEQRVHRAARHGVHHLRRHRDDGAARPGRRAPRVPRGQGQPAAVRGQGGDPAARKTPSINATWDEPAGEIVLKNYVNLGIAAATERGLIVPNIKDADQLSLLELAQAIAALTDTARAGRTSPADMTGGTITITNVGVFGVDTGTPILNPGEAGIVAFGAINRRPWVVGSGADERIEPRWVTQLAVSFDHRLVDGQQGSQFLADVAAVLSDPGLALL